jgi:tRNA nucleotidyltransferase/poly(A) polymerase
MALLREKGIHVIPTGIAHGTVTAIVEGRPYEITTLRQDLHTDGRHAEIAYTSSWEQDAQRRDFTINALYVDAQGELYDYYGGEQDIADGTLRFIGNPVYRIQEDYLRILRLFRFWAHYGKTVDPQSLQAAIQLKSHLPSLSKERITKEWIKLLMAKNPWAVVHTLWQNDFFPFLLGSWSSASEVPFFHFFRELERETGIAPCAWSRLLSLGACWPGDIKKLTSPLILSRREQTFLKDLNEYVTPDRLSHSVYESSVQITQYRVILSACRDRASPQISSAWTLYAVQQALHWLTSCDFPPFPVTGGDIVAMGVSGPSVGILMKGLKTWWLDQTNRPTKQECLAQAFHIISSWAK